MNLSVRESGPWQRTLEIEVPLEDVERQLDQVARGIQRRATLPGFRRGKVPLDLVRQNFARTVEEEFLESFVPQATREAVAEAKLDPVMPPLVRNVRFTPGAPVRFEAVVDVRPEVEVKDYRGLKLRRRVRTVDDAAVERVLNDLREESAVYVDLDRPAERGDVVLLDSTRIDAKGRRLSSSRVKNRRVELGGTGVPPDLENGLLGSTAGQERTVDVAYPPDYPVTELAGKDARYAVKIRKIQAKKLRELDDNFAREVFRLESLEDLRARVRLNLIGEERVRSQRELEASVTEELIRGNPIELPERLVDWMLDAVIADAVGRREIPDELRKDLEGRYRPGVERSLRREFLLEAVARKEALEVSDEEVAAEIDRLAQEDPRQAARVRAQYQSAERRQSLQASLRERKALEWMIQAAEIQDEVAGESPIVVPAAR